MVQKVNTPLKAKSPAPAVKFKFKVGDLVFAKQIGSRHWPAKIQNVISAPGKQDQYTVLYFGTQQTATAKLKDLFPYSNFKHEYGQPMIEKPRKGFNEGL